uniref:Uncharacterized protein n=1 Tax=Melopsittacus undulatus TaxID=13146 RepID=A0A8C6NDW3_MELUD
VGLGSQDIQLGMWIVLGKLELWSPVMPCVTVLVSLPVAEPGTRRALRSLQHKRAGHVYLHRGSQADASRLCAGCAPAAGISATSWSRIRFSCCMLKCTEQAEAAGVSCRTCCLMWHRARWPDVPQEHSWNFDWVWHEMREELIHHRVS